MRGSQRLKNGEIALLTRHTQLWTVVQTLTPKLPLLFSCVASYLCSRRARRSYFTFYLPITDVASTLQFMKAPKLSYRCVDQRHLKSSSKLPTSAGQKSTVKNRLVPDFYPDPVSINLSCPVVVPENFPLRPAIILTAVPRRWTPVSEWPNKSTNW